MVLAPKEEDTTTLKFAYHTFTKQQQESLGELDAKATINMKSIKVVTMLGFSILHCDSLDFYNNAHTSALLARKMNKAIPEQNHIWILNKQQQIQNSSDDKKAWPLFYSHKFLSFHALAFREKVLPVLLHDQRRHFSNKIQGIIVM